MEALDVEERLRNLHLRKIIRENHGAAIEDMVFNSDRGMKHMVATCGGGLVSVYDNNHCGNHLDLTYCFRNDATQYSLGGKVTKVAWIRVQECFRYPDAILAFGGETGEIGIVSMAATRVVDLLKGHTGAIKDLQAHPVQQGVLLSLGEDGKVRVWNAIAGFDRDGPVEATPIHRPRCLAVYDVECPREKMSKKSLQKSVPESIAVNPQGDSFVVGYSGGRIAEFALDVQILSKLEADTMSGSETETGGREICKDSGRGAIDCLVFTDPASLISHDSLGRIAQWDVKNATKTKDTTIPDGCKTRLSVSECGNFVCCGNNCGAVFIVDIRSMTRINKLGMPRVKGLVTAAAFSPGSESVALCTNDALLWRWDYALADANKVEMNAEPEDDEDEEDGDE